MSLLFVSGRFAGTTRQRGRGTEFGRDASCQIAHGCDQFGAAPWGKACLDDADRDRAGSMRAASIEDSGAEALHALGGFFIVD